MSAAMSDQQRAVLLEVLRRFAPPVERADLFGSRADGSARPGSDVDLALAGPLDAAALTRVSAALEESYLSVSADVCAYALLAPGPFRDRVMATARPLFGADELRGGRVADALGALADACAAVRGRWWVIGSAAAALHGADAGEVRDLDLLLEDAGEARALLARLGAAAPAGVPDDRFRSSVLGRAELGGRPLEVMAGLEVLGPGGWAPVLPATRVPLPAAGRTLWTPSRAELAALFRRFGRDKDLVRAAALGG